MCKVQPGLLNQSSVVPKWLLSSRLIQGVCWLIKQPSFVPAAHLAQWFVVYVEQAQNAQQHKVERGWIQAHTQWFVPFVPLFTFWKRGGKSVLGNMKTLCDKCILPSLLAAQMQQDVTYTMLAGVRRLRITKIPPRNRQKPLCALNCCLIHWVCHTMKW